MNNTIDLKPCPCCNCSNVVIRYGGSAWRSNVYYPKTSGYVSCCGCGLRTETYKYASKAVEKWNRRANEHEQA